MTTAPKNLLRVRELLLEHLKPHDLSSAEVGIVGDPAHRGGYHCGEDRVVRNDYSVVESDRDRDGLSDYASALDVGTFEVRVNGRTHNLMTFSVWLVAQCTAGTADTRDIREVIYSPDGKTVKRWDRERRRSSGDNSHLWHTHISFYRDATKAGRPLLAVFVRYLTEIGLIKPAEEDDVNTAEARRAAFLGVYDALYQMATGSTKEGRFMAAQLAELRGEQVAPVAEVDAAEIVAGLLASLTPEKIAEAVARALPPSLASQVVDDLVARLAA